MNEEERQPRASAAARLAPAAPPFSAFVQDWLDRIMPPGAEPLRLFTTLARDERLFGRFMSGGLLDRGHLSLRHREVVIGRITARCGSEYEWGVHVTYFADAAKLTQAQVQSFRDDAVSSGDLSHTDKLLISFCDAILETCDIDDILWATLRKSFSEEAIIELILLAGFYRTVASLTNALRLPLEPGTARFDDNSRKDK